jgi:hypothetical protein
MNDISQRVTRDMRHAHLVDYKRLTQVHVRPGFSVGGADCTAGVRLQVAAAG